MRNSKKSILHALSILKNGDRSSPDNRRDVNNAVGSIDGKHLALQKPIRSGTDLNYKGFSLVDVESSGSSPDAHIFVTTAS